MYFSEINTLHLYSVEWKCMCWCFMDYMLKNNWLLIKHYLLQLAGLAFIYLSKTHGHSKIKLTYFKLPTWPVSNVVSLLSRNLIRKVTNIRLVSGEKIFADKPSVVLKKYWLFHYKPLSESNKVSSEPKWRING